MFCPINGEIGKKYLTTLTVLVFAFVSQRLVFHAMTYQPNSLCST